MSVLDWIWPMPSRATKNERAAERQETKSDCDRIRALGSSSMPDLLLDAARRILEDEDGRKSSAETRATTYITAIAALIPLVTWVVSNNPNTCDNGFWCVVRTGLFVLAVVYLVVAAYWSLRALSVASYYCTSVEDILEITGKSEVLSTALIRETLLAARRNRDVINEKITYVIVAQRHFFNAVMLQGLLLIADPVVKNLWPALAAKVGCL